MLAVLTGQAATFRDAVFGTHSGDGKMNEYPMRSVRGARFNYIVNLRPEAEHHSHIDLGKAVDGREYWDSWVAATREDKRAASLVERYHRRPAEEFYDLEVDPFEQRNLAGDAAYAERLDEARGRLKAWMESMGDAGVETEEAVVRGFRR
jgi:uncharacterized sulfatase